MPTNFSEIENKEDSLDQVLKLAGLPSKFKLSANEFNLIKTKINRLKFLIDNLDLSGGAGIQSIERIRFVFHVTESNLQAFNRASFINSRPLFEIHPGQIPSFVFFIRNSDTGESKLMMYSLIGEQEGVFGNGGTRILTDSSLQLDFERLPTGSEVEEDPETQVINFPNISGEIKDWLNTQDPAIQMQTTSEGLVVLRGTILGEPASFLFVGTRDIYGQNEAQSQESDFEPLQESSNDNSITVDDQFIYNSLNPVQNKVLTAWKNNIEEALLDLDKIVSKTKILDDKLKFFNSSNELLFEQNVKPFLSQATSLKMTNDGYISLQNIYGEELSKVLSGKLIKKVIPNYSALPTNLQPEDEGYACYNENDKLLYIWNGVNFPPEGNGVEVIGEKGNPGDTPEFREYDGYLQVRYSETDTWTNLYDLSGIVGEKGDTPTIGNNGNWYISGLDTGVKAVAEATINLKTLYDNDIQGIRDGSNKKFTITESYSPGTLSVYLDGAKLSKGNNNDFIEINPGQQNNGAMINRVITPDQLLIFEFIKL